MRSSAVQVKVRIPALLNAEVSRMCGDRTSKSEWIEGAIRGRIERDSSEIAPFSDLPPAARERISAYIDLVRAAVHDEDLAALERSWERDKDLAYYDLDMGIPSTLDACVDAMVGRGSCRHIPAHRGAE